jgi:hypothetical protein
MLKMRNTYMERSLENQPGCSPAAVVPAPQLASLSWPEQYSPSLPSNACSIRYKVQGTRYEVQGTRHVQGTRYKVQVGSSCFCEGCSNNSKLIDLKKNFPLMIVSHARNQLIKGGVGKAAKISRGGRGLAFSVRIVP